MLATHAVRSLSGVHSTTEVLASTFLPEAAKIFCQLSAVESVEDPVANRRAYQTRRWQMTSFTPPCSHTHLSSACSTRPSACTDREKALHDRPVPGQCRPGRHPLFPIAHRHSRRHLSAKRIRQAQGQDLPISSPGCSLCWQNRPCSERSESDAHR